jgi:hypothetical protein
MNRTVHECPCGEVADTRVRVDWADGARTYWYCPECATDIENYLDGVTVLP